MKKTKKNEPGAMLMIVVFSCTCVSLLLTGCSNLRFAPSEAQKQNAWLHNRTATIAAQTARAENVSQVLQALTQLGEKQSQSFTAYYGLPNEFPPAETAEDILVESNWQLTDTALQIGADRPDPWQVADSMLELGIGVCALLGGVYGTRAVRFLKDARDKSKAIQEIIIGNEKFKKENESSAAAFKQAHSAQSPQTRQLVAQMKVQKTQ
jgi:hypothetical protein